MGSMFTKNSPGLVAWGNQGAERRKSHKTNGQQPGEPSSDTTQATVNTHQVEVHVCPSTQNKNEAHMVVLPDMMELQKTFPDGTETQSSESARVVSEISAVEPAAKVVDSTGDVMVGTEVQPTGLELQCEDETSSETREVPVAGQGCGGSSEGIKDTSSPESPLNSSVVLEEEISLEATPVVQEGTDISKFAEDILLFPYASW
uniref:Uncharacterized protein n=1 Tax=Sphaerodactylus townsendi TaxID=933632 RepID=A0ACB8G712_9SAUR